MNPSNAATLRRLFAVSYYRIAKDVAKLTDLLDHASIVATGIYIMESGAEHAYPMERENLVRKIIQYGTYATECGRRRRTKTGKKSRRTAWRTSGVFRRPGGCVSSRFPL